MPILNKKPIKTNFRSLMNMYFANKIEKVHVTEANPRSGRTVPFIAKAYGIAYVDIATQIMLSQNKLTDFTLKENLSVTP